MPKFRSVCEVDHGREIISGLLSRLREYSHLTPYRYEKETELLHGSSLLKSYFLH